MLIGIDGNEANLVHRVGVNQYAFDLLGALHRLPKRHRFMIYLKQPPVSDMPAPSSNWQYRVIPFPGLWTQTRLPFDLFFHTPRPDVFFTPSHYAPRFSPVPTVISIMDLGFLKSPDQFTPRDFNQLKSWTSYSVRQATKIITISQYTKDDVVRYYQKPPSDITVTYPGYDTGLFRSVFDNSILHKYGITKPYLLFLSSLKPSKNVEGLIHAYSRFIARSSGTPPGLVITGKKAWLYERIFTLVHQLKLQDQVIFTGFVPEKEVPVLMSSCLAFIMPSFHEGFGIPVVEAMACGVPVVVSRVASLPEVVGEAGFYVDPQSIDSICDGITAATGPGRTRMVKLGLDRVKSFDWAVTARKTLEVLSAAVKN